MRTFTLNCYKCKYSWDLSSIVVRTEECPNCREDARVCLNCKYYSDGHNNNCLETQASRVNDKTKANFCDYFLPKQAKMNQKTAEDKEKLEELFGQKNKSIPSNLSELEKLNNLFKNN